MIASLEAHLCVSRSPLTIARGSHSARREPSAMRRLMTPAAAMSPRRTPLSPRRRRRGLLALEAAKATPSSRGGGGPPPPGSPGDVDVRIRSEVEAPFRTVRLVLFGFFGGSATVGAAIAATQVLGALVRSSSSSSLNGDAAGGISLVDAATSLAIDLGAVGLFAFLFSRDWKARERQIARLQREADLGALRLKLSTGARRRLASLRGFARPVIVAGTRAQVEAAVAAAEPLREQLESRGVLIVPVPFLGAGEGEERGAGAGGAGGGGGGGGGGEEAAAPSASSSGDARDDLRWKAEPLDAAAWRAWFEQQAELANAKLENGLYVGLRIDGRVRASGSGSPPWAAFAVQLPPMEGVFKGFGDGFDGRV